jgi:hypothetical protein
MMSENNRQFPREDIQIEVELSFLEDESRTVITRDMSQGGLFLCLKDHEHYPMGEMVNLNYKDPFSDYTPIEKDAVIVRHTDDGIAVAFVEIDGF